MQVSEKGIDLIKSFEGCRLTAYRDSGGVLTIGYGHTAGVTPGMSISMAQAVEWLRIDIRRYSGYVEKLGEWSQCEFDALTSFCYNCGPGNLRKLVTGHTKQQIADTMLTYIHDKKGNTLAGLARRRKAERELFMSDKKPYDAIAKEVLSGRWGNGAERERRLAEAGYDPKEVQKRVNAFLRG